MTIHDKIGKEIERFGGKLVCQTCGIEKPLGDVSGNLKHGWPKCCGYTMRWITQNELEKMNTD